MFKEKKITTRVQKIPFCSTLLYIRGKKLTTVTPDVLCQADAKAGTLGAVGYLRATRSALLARYSLQRVLRASRGTLIAPSNRAPLTVAHSPPISLFISSGRVRASSTRRVP